jgi:hypothetical protein
MKDRKSREGWGTIHFAYLPGKLSLVAWGPARTSNDLDPGVFGTDGFIFTALKKAKPSASFCKGNTSKQARDKFCWIRQSLCLDRLVGSAVWNKGASVWVTFLLSLSLSLSIPHKTPGYGPSGSFRRIAPRLVAELKVNTTSNCSALCDFGQSEHYLELQSLNALSHSHIAAAVRADPEGASVWVGPSEGFSFWASEALFERSLLPVPCALWWAK